ncbi:ABC transporter permease [Macrococcoides caseolyticum]|uniref:ABC transporter permease n=1 Tax=Macrococcoides caseolyticum TaxID=69966 RepID=UPI001F1C1272|nr:ABC transporter permease [Macrococcus caseolyticus]MCE4955709.1 ABC transporter permease [Macrococcus caseolyticus]
MTALTIAKRIIKQIRRDKRTLLLLFLAPLLLLTLLYYIFQTADEGHALVGTYHTPGALNQLLDQHDIQHKKISSSKHIRQHIEQHRYDAIIVSKDETIDVYYKNIDHTKTMKIKQAMEGYKIKSQFTASQQVIEHFKSQFERIQQELSKMKEQVKQFEPVLNKVGIHIPESAPEKMNPSTSESIETHYIYGDKNSNYFDMINPVLIAFFIFFFTFLISGITLLKERTTGTLYKLLSTPVKRYEIVLGYLLGFSLFATLQTILLVLYAVYVLKIHVEGSLILFIVSNIVLAFVALGLGLFISTFAKSEFQMIQFIPLIIVPQLLFSGIIPIESMHRPLQILSYVMPLRYGADNLTKIMIQGQTIQILPNIIILTGFFIVLVAANIILLKRYRNI